MTCKTVSILFRLDPVQYRLVPHIGYGVFLILYAVVFAGSAAWMPLTYAMLRDPSMAIWIVIRVTLGVVALGSLGLLFALLRGGQKYPSGWYRLSVLGGVLFCWQTAVLDAIVWPYFFTL